MPAHRLRTPLPAGPGRLRRPHAALLGSHPGRAPRVRAHCARAQVRTPCNAHAQEPAPCICRRAEQGLWPRCGKPGAGRLLPAEMRQQAHTPT